MLLLLGKEPLHTYKARLGAVLLMGSPSFFGVSACPLSPKALGSLA